MTREILANIKGRGKMTDFRNILKKIAMSAFEYACGFIYVLTAITLIGLGLSEDLEYITIHHIFGNRLLVLLAGISMFVIPVRIWEHRKDKRE
jgi:hypothetical protein